MVPFVFMGLLGLGDVVPLLRKGWRPRPRLSVTEWSRANRTLQRSESSEHGEYIPERTPYLIEIINRLGPEDPSEFVIFMKPAQIGATEAGNNWLGFIMDADPGPILAVQPTDALAKRLSRQRVKAMLTSTPVLKDKVKSNRARDGGNTLLSKEFPGGILVITSASSAVGLRSMPARYLFLDEVDGYPHDVDGEGDPIHLALKRTDTFKRNRKIFMPSTPTVKELSRVEAWFLRGDQRYYHVPCPKCGHMHILRMGQMWWPKGKPLEAKHECPECSFMAGHEHKEMMLAGGEWIPTNPDAEPGKVSYHISGLYSPWYEWGELAQDFVDAKRKGAATLKTFINTVLAETWEERGSGVDGGPLFNRRVEYPAEVPDDVLVITAGADTQDDRIEVTTIGWCEGEEAYVLNHQILWGSPDRPEVWRDLDAVLDTPLKDRRGRLRRIGGLGIDTQGHHTHDVYKYCRARKGRRVFALRGQGGEGRPILGTMSRPSIGRSKVRINLFTIGVDEAKTQLYSRLTIEELKHGSGAPIIHFPVSLDREYFHQLTAEKVVTEYQRGYPKRVWHKIRERNETLDCFVYAMAALYILAPKWDYLAKKAGVAKDDDHSSDPKPVKRRRVLQKKSWVDDW